MLRLMGANEILYPYALAYMRYINIFLPVAVFSNYFAIFVRADEEPNRAMCGAALASAIGMLIQVLVGISHFSVAKSIVAILRCLSTA